MSVQKLRGVNFELYHTTTKVPGVHDITMTVTVQEIDASDHDSSGWGEKLTGTSDWSVDVSGIYKDQDTEQLALIALSIAGTAAAFKMRPNGTGTGQTEFSGNARVGTWTITGPQDGVQAFNFKLSGAGALTPGTQT